MAGQPTERTEEDDFLLLCAEFGLNDGRRRGLLWHSLCRARGIGGMQVCISLRAVIGHGHPHFRRPLSLSEVHQAIKFYQKQAKDDMGRWHDLPEKYATFDRGEELAPTGAHNPVEVGSIPTPATKENANDATGETTTVCERGDTTQPDEASHTAGECGGCDDVG